MTKVDKIINTIYSLASKYQKKHKSPGLAKALATPSQRLAFLIFTEVLREDEAKAALVAWLSAHGLDKAIIEVVKLARRYGVY